MSRSRRAPDAGLLSPDLAVVPCPTPPSGRPLMSRWAATWDPASTGPHCAALASPRSTKARMAANGEATTPSPAPLLHAPLVGGLDHDMQSPIVEVRSAVQRRMRKPGRQTYRRAGANLVNRDDHACVRSLAPNATVVLRAEAGAVRRACALSVGHDGEGLSFLVRHPDNDVYSEPVMMLWFKTHSICHVV